MYETLNVRDFGAIGDGIADDTEALQNAIDTAAESGQSLFIPQGEYRSRTLTLHPEVYLSAEPTWGFGWDACGKTVIRQADVNMVCQIDLTEARGCTIRGLSLMGLGIGQCIGMLSRKADFGSQEDSYRIEDCCISHYGGHAMLLDHVSCFSIRHSQLGFCGGDGLHVNGWNGFILDNWLSGNTGSGYYGEHPNSSITMTSNRIEWNAGDGIFSAGGGHYNITGNYIDRSGRAALHLRRVHTATCTGNIMYRSGKHQEQEDESVHCVLEHCQGITFIGNSMKSGQDDHQQGVVSPVWSMRLHNLTDCIISSNTMYKSSLLGLIDDRGGHDNLIVTQNVGRESVELYRQIRIDEYFNTHYSESISEDDLAQHFNLSKRQLNRILQNIYNMSFREKLILVRMQQAKQLLLSTDHSIEAIAEMVGYSSLSGFYYAFRKTYNIAAGEYRKILSK